MGMSMFMPATEVSAASGINGNESRVLAVVQSTFRYDGKYYRAKAEYISQVTAYLNQDDVDLTAEQANTVVNRIYSSVGQGVSDGYLYEVQVATTEEKTTKDEDATEDTGTEDATSEEDSTEDTTESTTENKYGVDLPTEESGIIIVEATTAVDSGIDLEDNIWAEVSGYESLDEGALEERPEEEEADTKVVYDEEKGGLMISTKNGEMAVDDIEQILPSWFSVLIFALSLFCVLGTGICTIVLGVNSCFIWKNQKNRGKRKGHSKRRRIRKVTRWILTVTCVVELLSILIGVTGYIGLYRQDSIMTNLNTSGYFRYAYNLYCDETEEPIEYEKFLFDAKNEITNVLAGKEIEEPLLKMSVATYIYQVKSEVNNIGQWAVPVFVICLLLDIFLLIFLDGLRYRGERHITIATAVTTIVILAFATVMQIFKPYAAIYIEPDYLYLFLYDYCQWITQILFVIGSFGVAISLILTGLYRSMRKNLEQG